MILQAATCLSNGLRAAPRRSNSSLRLLILSWIASCFALNSEIFSRMGALKLLMMSISEEEGGVFEASNGMKEDGRVAAT